MAGRIRTIKPEILEDDDTGMLSHAGFRLFIGLITLADDYGNLRGNPDYLNGQVFWGTKADTGAALRELQASKLVVRYRVEGKELLSIRNWAKHQKVDKKGNPRVAGPESQGAEITPFAEPSRNTRERSPTPREENPPYPTTTTTNDLDHDLSLAHLDGERARAFPMSRFESVYQIYPRKQGKQKGLTSAQSKVRTEADFQALSDAVTQMAQAWRGKETKYCPHWSTFINQERWRDDELPLPGTPTSPAASRQANQRGLSVADIARMAKEAQDDENRGTPVPDDPQG